LSVVSFVAVRALAIVVKCNQMNRLGGAGAHLALAKVEGKNIRELYSVNPPENKGSGEDKRGQWSWKEFTLTP
jgi:hypothetical protein